MTNTNRRPSAYRASLQWYGKSEYTHRGTKRGGEWWVEWGESGRFSTL